MPTIFLSYVRENLALVQRLKRDLMLRGAMIWLDRDNLTPGVRWQNQIQNAIRNGDYFLACFSVESQSRNRTWMNKELQLAIQELWLRPINRAWFIPVKFSPCDIPEYQISPSEKLDALQHVELYDAWETGVNRIAASVGLAQEPEQGLPGTGPDVLDTPTITPSEDYLGVNIGEIATRGNIDLVNVETRTPETPDNSTAKTSLKIEKIRASNIRITNRRS